MFAGRKVKLNPGTVDLVQFMGLVITIKTVMPNDKNMKICYLVEPLKIIYIVKPVILLQK